ncbi:hypothetical protein LFL96_23115 [Paraburkholderia sp. D15]|uniref:hypothetical protein n=1 Tax=Paraburkholderia sp. D15 TaxID=2880218 RepID=UPI002479DCF9|nr:hypothetical protein [Paraburkholderia sp. D15]WGS53931.1 hypothetical protein LFL96_23115 [Paraburkholderia sp. D15]
MLFSGCVSLHDHRLQRLLLRARQGGTSGGRSGQERPSSRSGSHASRPIGKKVALRVLHAALLPVLLPAKHAATGPVAAATIVRTRAYLPETHEQTNYLVNFRYLMETRTSARGIRAVYQYMQNFS